MSLLQPNAFSMATLPLYYTGISDPAEDVRGFMNACEQEPSAELASLYFSLVQEEMEELSIAFNAGDRVEILDGGLDLIWVTLGLLRAMQLPTEAGWKEVRRSNYEKIALDGKVLRRDDGKIMKPTGWLAPRLQELVEAYDALVNSGEVQ